jgi:hypothetical protein
MLATHRSGTISSALLAGAVVLTAWAPRMGLGETLYGTTLDNNVTNIYGAIYPNTSPHYDAIDFQTGDGGVLSVDQDVDFNCGRRCSASDRGRR